MEVVVECGVVDALSIDEKPGEVGVYVEGLADDWVMWAVGVAVASKGPVLLLAGRVGRGMFGVVYNTL